ncbi:MAG: SET domain-containing protein-lysine N-methyltransferase [Planctomycetota bacterium]
MDTTGVEVRASGIHGLGVFATRGFAAGEVVWTLDDSRVVDDAHPLLPEAGEHEDHCDYLADGTVILMPSPERHINSSCDPNTFVRTDEDGDASGVRRVVARRKIAAEEEVTYDYIIDCHGGDVWECACGSTRCRRTIVSSFFELPEAWQREYLPLLNPWFVAQHRERVDALRGRLGHTKGTG